MKEFYLSKKKEILSLIGIAIIFLFPLLQLGNEFITPLGQQVLGVFIGTIFLWSTVSMIWPSILSVSLLGFYNYKPMSELLTEWLGNPTLIMILFLLILVNTFTYYGGTQYIGRFLLTRKIIEKRPWVFTFIILIGAYFVATFVNAFAGVFLFLPLIHDVCKQLGYCNNDKYNKLMTIAVVMASLLGFPTAYYDGAVLALTTNYEVISNGAYVMSNGLYMLVALVIGILSITAITLVMKYILKPDVECLKNVTVEELNENPLPPMSVNQKIVFGGIIVFILSMLLPLIFPQLPIMQFLHKNIHGLAMVIVGLLAAITIKGKPVLNFSQIMSSNFSWETYLMIASSLVLGDALTSDSVGFNSFLQHFLSPVFKDMDYMVFIVVIIIISVIITNFMNSFVYVLLIQPVILTFSTITQINTLPVLMLVIFTSLATAAVTPSASPYAAVIYGQKDFVHASDIYKYATLFVLMELIVILLVGVPLATLVF